MKTYLKHMKGMIQNIKKMLEQGNSRVLRWALWLEVFDFDIIHKIGKENYLANMMTREGTRDLTIISINKKIEIGEISSKP